MAGTASELYEQNDYDKTINTEVFFQEKKMTPPKNRILMAITFSLLLIFINIIAVSNGTAESIYMQLENSIFN